MSQALIDAPVTTCPADNGTVKMSTSWSTTTTDTASGRSVRLASWAAFNDAALPAPRVARTRPGTYLESIGMISAIPHAAAGITPAFSTTMAMTSATRCSGATSSRTVKAGPVTAR